MEGRKVDVRLPGKGNLNSHVARPVHLIITLIKWIRTRRLSIQNSLSLQPAQSFGPYFRLMFRGGLAILVNESVLPFDFRGWAPGLGFDRVSGFGVDPSSRSENVQRFDFRV